MVMEIPFLFNFTHVWWLTSLYDTQCYRRYKVEWFDSCLQLFKLWNNLTYNHVISEKAYPGICWRRSSRGHDHQLTLRLDPGTWRLLTLSCILEICVLPAFPALKAASRTQPWETNVLLRPSAWNMWLNPVKAFI